MLPRRASPQAKWGATNVTVFMLMTTKGGTPLFIGASSLGVKRTRRQENEDVALAPGQNQEPAVVDPKARPPGALARPGRKAKAAA
jgi:hypothetical protein